LNGIYYGIGFGILIGSIIATILFKRVQNAANEILEQIEEMQV
jgi:Na+/glutamate symporter